MVAWTAQRDATHVEMHEVDSYLRQRMKEAREAENRRMLQDDREYTMKHRPAYTGLPVKPSLLQLEEEQLTKYALVDPLDIMQENAQDRLKAQEAPKDMPFMKAEVRLGRGWYVCVSIPPRRAYDGQPRVRVS
jgi:hypothetical protein